MPVTTCSTNTTSVALPKTYHQLADERGTRCVAASVKLASGPRGTHASCASRRSGDTRNRSTGTANAAAAAAFSTRPSEKRKPRRDTGGSAWVGRGVSSSVVVPRGVRPARHLRAVRDQPGDHVGDVPGRHRRAFPITPPARHAERGPSDQDGGAQSLVAHQLEI